MKKINYLAIILLVGLLKKQFMHLVIDSSF